MAVPKFGEGGQRRLNNSSIGVVGAGGVKSPMLYYLAAAGVGHIRIIDPDHVELSNLNRQILYTVDDIGKPKATSAVERLERINPEIKLESFVERVDASNFESLLCDFDLLIEGGDSAAGRKEFNACALAHNKSYIHASAQYNYSYVMTVVPGESSCFQCAFSDIPDTHGGPVPIMGSAAGIAGSVAASEAISILSGNGANLTDNMFFYDGWSAFSTSLKISRRPDCSICGRSDLKSAI